MDPNITKLLQEDEDETMHSGADLEAALNRDIEGDTSTSMIASSDNDVHMLDAHREENPDRESQLHKRHNMTNQQPMTVAANNQNKLAIGTTNQQQQGYSFKFDQLSRFGLLLPIIVPQLDKNRAKQLQTLHFRLTKNEISKDFFVRHMRSIVGDGVLKKAVYKLQPHQATRNTQTSTDRELQVQKLHNMTNKLPIATAANNQRKWGIGTRNQQQGNSLKVSKQVPFGLLLPIIQPQLDKDRAIQVNTLYYKLKKNEMSKDHFVRHIRSIVGEQMLQMAVAKLRPQQNSRNTQTSQPQASPQQRQMLSTAHQNMNANQLGGTSQATRMMNMPKFGRPDAFGESNKMQGTTNGGFMNNSTILPKMSLQWPSSTSKEQKVGVSSSLSYVEQEPVDQSNDQQHKIQLSPPQVAQGNAAGNLKDKPFETHSSRMGPTMPMSMLPTYSVPSSIARKLETLTIDIQLSKGFLDMELIEQHSNEPLNKVLHDMMVAERRAFSLRHIALSKITEAERKAEHLEEIVKERDDQLKTVRSETTDYLKQIETLESENSRLKLKEKENLELIRGKDKLLEDCDNSSKTLKTEIESLKTVLSQAKAKAIEECIEREEYIVV